MMIRLQGRARILPDAVNTDYIISSSRKRQTEDMDELKQYVFEDLPDLSGGAIQSGDVIVAGFDFGCGSAMEIAVDILMKSGIQCILAKSVARTYYRNATNAGLPIVIWETGCVREGDELTIKYGKKPTVNNESKNCMLECKPVPNFVTQVVRAGGLIEYKRKCGMPARGALE